jgi:hypothetical protein
LKLAHAVVVEEWKVLIPICSVSQLWKRDARNLKDYHIWQTSNVKLFGHREGNCMGIAVFEVEQSNVQLRWKYKAAIRQSGVRCHVGNSLDPRKNYFLKIAM